MKETYIRSIFITDRSKFIEQFKNCKQIGKILDLKNKQTRPQAKKPIFFGLESEKYRNQVPNFENFEKHIKNAPGKTVQNGSYTSPNELARNTLGNTYILLSYLVQKVDLVPEVFRIC